MRMSMCPVCSGLPELKPCRPFCLNVVKGCLAYHAELAVEWDNYIGTSSNNPLFLLHQSLKNPLESSRIPPNPQESLIALKKPSKSPDHPQESIFKSDLIPIIGIYPQASSTIPDNPQESNLISIV